MGLLFTTGGIKNELLAMQTEHLAAHRAEIVAVIGENATEASLPTTLLDLATALANIRKSGVPCSEKLESRRASAGKTVTVGADSSFCFGGVAFEPFAHRSLNNIRRRKGTDATLKDLAVRDAVQVDADASTDDY